MDGDTSQLKGVTVTNMKKYEDNNITFNKHNASNTANEQSCDKGDIFPTIEEEYNKISEEDLPTDDDPLKICLDEAFAAHRGRLNLSSTKRTTLTNVVCIYPGVASKAFTKHKTMKGWFRNGNLDRKYKLLPVLDIILGTCKRKIPKEVYDRL